MALFVVCAATFRLLYVLFVIRHLRRQIVHFNVTEHPTAAWVIQQIREAFPYGTAPKYFIFDRDSIFSAEVVGTVKAVGANPTRTSYRSPWQNGTAERWIGSARAEVFDHVIVLDEAQGAASTQQASFITSCDAAGRRSRPRRSCARGPGRLMRARPR